MKVLLYSILTIIFFGCNSYQFPQLTYVATLPCDSVQSREMAVEFFRAKGYDLESLKTEITEDSLHFIISYTYPNYPELTDNGGRVIVRKDSCRISRIYDGTAVIHFIRDDE